MPTACASDGSERDGFGPTSPRIVPNWISRSRRTLGFSAVLACFWCGTLDTRALAAKAEVSASVQSSVSARKESQKKLYRREGYAVWYVVPPNSLAKRRAGKGELTAAHNRLPLGTMVRVTHLANGQSVIVRITDRGVTKRGATIDLCKEAAEKLQMVREGMARVRLEELPDDKAGTPDSTSTAAHP
jgi:rare lipoprotein A